MGMKGERVRVNISQRLKEIREKSGFTQKELAERAGLATITIQGYEENKFKPKLGTLEKIAHALNVSIDCFLYQSEKQRPLTLEELETPSMKHWKK